MWAVAVIRNNKIVGHVPREPAEEFSRHRARGKTITMQVTGRRENRRRRGLEVPAIYTLYEHS